MEDHRPGAQWLATKKTAVRDGTVRIVWKPYLLGVLRTRSVALLGVALLVALGRALVIVIICSHVVLGQWLKWSRFVVVVAKIVVSARDSGSVCGRSVAEK